MSAAVAAHLLLPLALSGQTHTPQLPTGRAGQLTVLSFNAALGGATALIGGLLRSEPSLAEVLTGMAGGGAIYTGKRVSVTDFAGAGLLGRQIGMLGSAVVASSARGDPPFQHTWLAFGPARVAIGPPPAGSSRFRVDVLGAALVMGALLDPAARIDLRESLSRGALAVRDVGSFAGPGVLFFAGATEERRAYVLAHESVHVIQFDHVFLLWNEPLNRVLLGNGAEVSVVRYLDLSTLAPAAMLFARLRDFDERSPWEVEARFLARER